MNNLGSSKFFSVEEIKSFPFSIKSKQEKVAPSWWLRGITQQPKHWRAQCHNENGRWATNKDPSPVTAFSAVPECPYCWSASRNFLTYRALGSYWKMLLKRDSPNCMRKQNLLQLLTGNPKSELGFIFVTVKCYKPRCYKTKTQLLFVWTTFYAAKEISTVL